MEELPEGVDSKFRYVLLVAKRAEQLVQGSAPKSKSRSAALRTVVVELKTEVERIREQVQNVE